MSYNKGENNGRDDNNSRKNQGIEKTIFSYHSGLLPDIEREWIKKH
jgi:hypothetical protein